MVVGLPRKQKPISSIGAVGVFICLVGIAVGLARVGGFSSSPSGVNPSGPANVVTAVVNAQVPENIEFLDSGVTMDADVGVNNHLVVPTGQFLLSDLTAASGKYDDTSSLSSLSQTYAFESVNSGAPMVSITSSDAGNTGKFVLGLDDEGNRDFGQHEALKGRFAQSQSLSPERLRARTGPVAVHPTIPTALPISVQLPKPPLVSSPVPTPAPAPAPSAMAPPLPTAEPTPVPTPVGVESHRLASAITPELFGTLGISPASDDGRYGLGTNVDLTATCDFGFITWKGSVPKDAIPSSISITVTMDRDRILVAVCALPTPTPAPTVIPTATPLPIPVPGFILRVNGIQVMRGQEVVRVPGGDVVLDRPPQLNGAYVPGDTVSMEAIIDIPGAKLTWSGVNTKYGNKATVIISGERHVIADIEPPSATPAPTPIRPTPQPTPLPTPILGITQATATPQPEADLQPTSTLGPTAMPTPTPPPTPTPLAYVGRIAFVSNRDNTLGEIYVMDADGSNQIRLTSNAFDDQSPVWSPDGSRIAFASERYGNWGIYVMGSDGSDQTRITSESTPDRDPSWSPDGTKITFSSDHNGLSDIYVMNADGSAQNRLTTGSGSDFDPSWSPNGVKIIYTSSRDGNDEIYAMNSDGSNQIRLTNNNVADGNARWSPDGQFIAFASEHDGNWEIYSMTADGSFQTRLTSNPEEDLSPSWSPDGANISFVSLRNSPYGEIFIMDANGSNQNRITSNTADDLMPVWGP